jgi:hypothetical protein
MIGIDHTNDHVREQALEFLIQALAGNDDRAHELADNAIFTGVDFVHDFYGALYAHIVILVKMLKSAHPNSVKLITKLSADLKVGKGTNFWDIYAIRTKHPLYKINEKSKTAGRKDDPTSYWKGEWR